MIQLRKSRNYKNLLADRELSLMLEASRQRVAGQALSAAGRSRVLSESLRGAAAPEPFPALFTPLRRLVAASALPAGLAAALLTGLGQEVRPPAPAGAAVTVVEATKQGDQVLFNIRNKKPSHKVYRSTSAAEFDEQLGQSVADGAFTEPLEGSGGLVFYRID